MKIAVTGAAGYIGSHLCKFLYDKNCTVTAFDKNWQQNDIKDFANCRTWDITEATYQQTFDIVIHLAAETKVSLSVENPIIYYKTNIVGTQNVLNTLKCDYFINASSSSAFQPSASPYALSKNVAEAIVKQHTEQSTNLRFYNVSGNNGFIKHDAERYHLIRKTAAVANGLYPAVDVYGSDYATKDGTPERNYTHISDIVQSVWNVIENKPTTMFECLGTTESYSVLDIIKIMEEVSGKSIEYNIKSKRPGDVGKSTILASSKYFSNTHTIQDQCLSALAVETV
jgi:UDP-glucose 4-epimerase